MLNPKDDPSKDLCTFGRSESKTFAQDQHDEFKTWIQVAFVVMLSSSCQMGESSCWLCIHTYTYSYIRNSWQKLRPCQRSNFEWIVCKKCKNQTQSRFLKSKRNTFHCKVNEVNSSSETSAFLWLHCSPGITIENKITRNAPIFDPVFHSKCAKPMVVSVHTGWPASGSTTFRWPMTLMTMLKLKTGLPQSQSNRLQWLVVRRNVCKSKWTNRTLPPKPTIIFWDENCKKTEKTLPRIWSDLEFTTLVERSDVSHFGCRSHYDLSWKGWENPNEAFATPNFVKSCPKPISPVSIMQPLKKHKFSWAQLLKPGINKK